MDDRTMVDPHEEDPVAIGDTVEVEEALREAGTAVVGVEAEVEVVEEVEVPI